MFNKSVSQTTNSKPEKTTIERTGAMTHQPILPHVPSRGLLARAQHRHLRTSHCEFREISNFSTSVFMDLILTTAEKAAGLCCWIWLGGGWNRDRLGKHGQQKIHVRGRVNPTLNELKPPQ
jgi:hypothetical protein